MNRTGHSFPPVREQMDLLLRGAHEIISPEELEQKCNDLWPQASR